MLLPDTEWCHRCIDRQIAQAALLARLVSDPADLAAQRRLVEELVGKRMRLTEDQAQGAAPGTGPGTEVDGVV